MTSPTLQDFVLNLIYDPAARSAFEIDPEATLRHAGLDDVTAADVQQVLPLVLDSAPVTGLTGPDGLDGLTTGVASLDVAGAVAQLQAITAQVTPDTLADLHATSNANVTVLGLNADGLADVSLPGVFDLGVGTSVTAGGLSAEHDPALDLDVAVTTPAAVASDSTTASISGVTSYDNGPADHFGALDPVTDISSPVLSTGSGLLDATGVDEATSSIGSLIKPDLGDTVTGAVDGLDSTVTGVVTGVDSTLHGLTGGLLSGTGEAAEEQDTFSTYGDG
ncbi:IniB N-terminal domain-containing protein [Actinoplanes derwentensis]|uniref:Uncharacterized protein n=1 Tax=Actinoplanes derwentensis TaxID=113562 RepID=A0A1H2DEF0_9ACTN|nr:IniB N-terminal domain-containing protein [Actinoplanes derwentensis]GID84846.1 hypothetical protein Ade03nite_37700 [Actinoplanes derwentensis]SDT80959.1 hypothetical protein SAMN04489716_9435 [Actinoplanes derwentensis]